MEQLTTDEDGTVYVSQSEGDVGSKGPFFVAYRTEAGDRPYGWYCSNCGGLDVAMDAMGRVECNACGNRRKPTEWDSAHE